MNSAKTPIAENSVGVTRISILGATGSVGRAAADVIGAHRERFKVVSVVGGQDADGLATLARRLNAEFAALANPDGLPVLREALAGTGITCGAGDSAVMEAVDRECDLVVGAIVGVAGLKPTHAALKPGRRLALANKECLVSAGEAFMRDAAGAGVPILPVDSEHNALLQALGGHEIADVERMTLTASGGPFRTWSAAHIAQATPEDALAHPNWSMGRKITIDSASLMNKGLELIEAHHLFDITPDLLEVIVHPQSVVHGLVAFRDGAVNAGLAAPDMRVPLAHCLGLPSRLSMDTKRLDLAAIGSLTFETPDEERFPALRLARAALAAGGAATTVLNAANEIAVAAFLDRQIGFGAIPQIVEAVCDRMCGQNCPPPASIDEALAIDSEARALALGEIGASASKDNLQRTARAAI